MTGSQFPSMKWLQAIGVIILTYHFRVLKKNVKHLLLSGMWFGVTPGIHQKDICLSGIEQCAQM
jgi:hypothetical protein